jgi:hypothetical protein
MKDPWFVTLWRAGYWIVSRVLLPILFIASPVMVLIGAQKPDSNAIAALHLNSNQTALLVGTGGGVRCVGEACSQESTHTYLIWPGLSGASVMETSDGLKAVPVPGAGIVVFLAWLLGGWCMWRYWLKPITGSFRKSGGLAK